MLFPYIYVPHDMEKMQGFIDFIFFEVWCKAPIGLEFHPDLFEKIPDLKEVMSEFGFSEKPPESGKTFYKNVENIYLSFSNLKPQEIDQFKQWYEGNNDIEKVCANDAATQLVRYADIPVIHKKLIEQLESFFKGLYSLDLVDLKDKVGNIDDHYKEFIKKNFPKEIVKGRAREQFCPFCGLVKLKGEFHTKRNPYDHYLPKVYYPFNSINFFNLVPACHDCNSNYKTIKDPAYVPKDRARKSGGCTVRRKSFYPFSEKSYVIELQIALSHMNFKNMESDDITLTFGPAEIGEEIDTWKDVYGIEERYKAEYCDNSWIWIELLMDEWTTKTSFSPAVYLDELKRHEKLFPYTDLCFLKRPFLEACQQKGLF